MESANQLLALVIAFLKELEIFDTLQAYFVALIVLSIFFRLFGASRG